MADEWGPLAALVGEWQGEGGLDTAFSHSRGEVFQTPYLEKVTMKPFGPVDNGSQHLYGLDYKTAMWRDERREPVPHRGRATGCGTAPPVRSCAASWCRVASPCWPAALPQPTRRRSPCRPTNGGHELRHRREPVSGRQRELDQLRGDDHPQRRRHVELRRDDDVADERVRRAVRPHRSQHVAPRQLTRPRAARWVSSQASSRARASTAISAL